MGTTTAQKIQSFLDTIKFPLLSLGKNGVAKKA